MSQLRFKNFVEYAYSTFFLLPKQVKIYVYGNLNINAFEPSCILSVSYTHLTLPTKA